MVTPFFPVINSLSMFCLTGTLLFFPPDTLTHTYIYFSSPLRYIFLKETGNITVVVLIFC